MKKVYRRGGWKRCIEGVGGKGRIEGVGEKGV